MCTQVQDAFDYLIELQPYKYAGYSQLIKTIQLETADAQLFSKPAPLLVAATELAHHTINCSALNAEELNREGGFQVMCHLALLFILHFSIIKRNNIISLMFLFIFLNNLCLIY